MQLRQSWTSHAGAQQGAAGRREEGHGTALRPGRGVTVRVSLNHGEREPQSHPSVSTGVSRVHVLLRCS